jgi:Tol biopolymer transport system component
MDIFVRDQLAGITGRVSVDSFCGEANDDSDMPTISSDGRYVAFHSEATNLVPGDTNGSWDIFVHDCLTGETTRVSVDSMGIQGDDDSQYPDLSPDGRYVAFQSDAANLVPGDTNNKTDIFVHDCLTGVTTRVSVDSAGVESNGYSQFADLSLDGRYVAFDSSASNLVPGDTNYAHDIFVHDRNTGETTRVSVNSMGEQAKLWSHYAAITPDGRFVTFHSDAYNLVPGDTNNCLDIFVHDRTTGQTIRVNVDSSGGEANDQSSLPAISWDGRRVVFKSWADNLVPGDTNEEIDTFVNSRLSLWTDTATLPETGGTVNFFLDAWDSQAGREYLILGSITGKTPGIPLPGGTATLPVNWDLFTNLVVNLMNTPVFANFYGTLDASGSGAAQFNAPAMPGAAGLTMYFAYALCNPWDFASNPVEIEIL